LLFLVVVVALAFIGAAAVVLAVCLLVQHPLALKAIA
jgi:hypothetical protein